MGAFLILLGAAIGVEAWACATGRVRRNAWFGVRTPTTYRSEAAWAAAQQKVAPWITGASAVLVVGGALSLALHSTPTALAAFFCAMGLSVIGELLAGREARRVARA